MHTARVTRDFRDLVCGAWHGYPGRFGFLISASDSHSHWSVGAKSDEQFNIASAFKVFIVAECLRQVENDLVTLEDRLELTESVRVPDNCKSLSEYPDGSLIPIRQLLEAMISVSDNTATEMVMRRIGHENTLRMLRELGLTRTHFPASLRAMCAYAIGSDPGIMYWELVKTCTAVKPPAMNRRAFDGEFGILSSPQDLVTFYQQAFSGRLFRKRVTVEIFKEIMHLEDTSFPFPWSPGVECYRKSGYLELPPYYASALAGITMSEGRQFHFAFCFNLEASNDEQLNQSYSAFRHGMRLAFERFAEQLAPSVTQNPAKGL